MKLNFLLCYQLVLDVASSSSSSHQTKPARVIYDITNWIHVRSTVRTAGHSDNASPTAYMSVLDKVPESRSVVRCSVVALLMFNESSSPRSDSCRHWMLVGWLLGSQVGERSQDRFYHFSKAR
ncbi:hypothetical protein F4782DRAFT_230352 [Xylaria castorea]|nr:hypothetical protein F4782DRAFT_230352 [Xylaria castorea]